MDNFHIITLVVASVSLILVLTIAGILLKKDEDSQKFPTSHKDVPDGWERSVNTSNDVYTLTHTPVDVEVDDTTTNYTNPSTPVPDGVFIGAVWKDIDICEKKKWADQNNVYWDGVTTYNGC